MNNDKFKRLLIALRRGLLQIVREIERQLEELNEKDRSDGGSD